MDKEISAVDQGTSSLDRWNENHLRIFNKLLAQQVGLSFLNADQRITFANRVFAEKLGHKETSLIGSPALRLSVSSSLSIAGFSDWIDLKGARASTHGALRSGAKIKNLHLSAKSFHDATQRLFRLLIVVEMSDFGGAPSVYLALRRDLDLLLREP